MLALYAVYIISTFAFDCVSIKMMGASTGVTLWNISDMPISVGGSSGIGFFLILAFLSIVVPVIWPDKRAWLALLLPLVPLLQLVYTVTSAMSQVKSQMAMVGGNISVSNMFSIGLGGYGVGIAAIGLAIYGLKRALLPSAA
ncbi:MAG: hypothetical protein LBV49_06395 [Azonexus sp.]|nr:hypothetical protein [Azonexus sp.]